MISCASLYSSNCSNDAFLIEEAFLNWWHYMPVQSPIFNIFCEKSLPLCQGKKEYSKNLDVIQQRGVCKRPWSKEQQTAVEEVTVASGSAAGPMAATSGMGVSGGAAVSWMGVMITAELAGCCCCRLTRGWSGLALDCSRADAWKADCCCCWWPLCTSWCYTGTPHSQWWRRPSSHF